MQRDLLLASLQDSQTAHAIYDPLGRPVIYDIAFQGVLERLDLSTANALASVWAALHGDPTQIERVLTGHQPVRAEHPTEGLELDTWLYSCSHRNEILGVGLELVDISQVQANAVMDSGLLDMFSSQARDVLAAIQVFAEVLIAGDVDGPEIGARIISRCEELVELLQQLEEGRDLTKRSTLEPTPLRELLAAVVAQANHATGQPLVTLSLTPDGLQSVLAHEVPLTQALLALLLELTGQPPATSSVHISTRSHAGMVEISIHGDGPAPPLGILRQLAEAPDSRGSAQARRLVEDMGGSFSIEGGGEDGARYRVYLPLA